ncbi:MAG: Rossmann-like and DUF2520 domain-containing protein [Bacteroidia bacterium]
MPLKIVIVGAGKIAWSLIPALQKAGADIIQLISRSASSRKKYASAYHIPHQAANLNALNPAADWVILSIPDQAIGDTAEQLKGILQPHQVLLHTSGSTDIQTLQIAGGKKAVLYPMQIFTTDAVADFSRLPIFIEADADVLPSVERLARDLSQRVYPLDSDGRMQLHLGAVIACNFSNYLYRWAQEAMPKIEGIDFNIYEPLVREQVDKVFAHSPENTQTGPALRGDLGVLLKHLSLLDQEEQRRLYRWLSLQINEQLPI